jgi:hypothetical protein
MHSLWSLVKPVPWNAHLQNQHGRVVECLTFTRSPLIKTFNCPTFFGDGAMKMLERDPITIKDVKLFVSHLLMCLNLS